MSSECSDVSSSAGICSSMSVLSSPSRLCSEAMRSSAEGFKGLEACSSTGTLLLCRSRVDVSSVLISDSAGGAGTGQFNAGMLSSCSPRLVRSVAMASARKAEFAAVAGPADPINRVAACTSCCICQTINASKGLVSSRVTRRDWPDAGENSLNRTAESSSHQRAGSNRTAVITTAMRPLIPLCAALIRS